MNHTNNSKKISELRSRNIITTYQGHTWIPVAQYNGRTDSYTNIALSLEAITSYTNSYAAYLTTELRDEVNELTYNWKTLNEITKHPGEESYYINQSPVAYTLVGYTFAYTVNYFGWQVMAI